MTAVYLEGLVAGLRLALAVADAERTARYARACSRAIQFVDGLIYQERDRPLLPDFDRALGGLRMSQTATDIRIDFVQHALGALIDLQSLPLSALP